MRVFGLIGYPLDHSWSPAYFLQKFKQENNFNDTYKLFPLPHLQGFKQFIEHTKELCGLNVTIPYKEEIIQYLDEIDDLALQAGAVNTIVLSKTNNTLRTRGYNTDITGFELTLKPCLKAYHRNALILGTGGASKAVAFVLNKLGIPFTFVSRKKIMENCITYDDVVKLNLIDYQIIINTTPVGQHPKGGNPLPLETVKKLTDKHFLYDLVYNPLETEFLKVGQESGAFCVNGLEMLKIQAEESWKIWNYSG
ncbi:MAG: shikimate dehydrogenase [Bacteroidales bacterium]